MRATFPLSIALTIAILAAAPATAKMASADAAENDVLGVGISLAEVPASAQSDPRAQRYIIDNVAPGGTIERTINVSNGSSTAQTISVYSGAASLAGGSFVPDQGDSPNLLTSWTSIGASTIELNADETAQTTVTIAVPSDAPEGELYSAIWAQVSSDPDASGSIATANRSGIRIYLSVGAGNGPAANFSIDSLVAVRNADGDPEVVANVTNTGGRAVDIQGALSLSEGPSGLSAGPFDITTTTTLAPATSGEVLISLDSELPNGPWMANLTLTSGLLSHDATAQLTFPDAGTGDTVAVAEDGPNLPLIIGAVILVLLILGAGAIFRIRRRALATTRSASASAPAGSKTSPPSS